MVKFQVLGGKQSLTTAGNWIALRGWNAGLNWKWATVNQTFTVG